LVDNTKPIVGVTMGDPAGVGPTHPRTLDASRHLSYKAITSGLAAAVLVPVKVGAVLLAGGEMASAFLNKLEARGLTLETELLPGIVLGTVMSGKADGLKIVTKAGGFGISSEKLLLYLVRRRIIGRA
jgi:uncharacterized protein YgbK (DUF1537 family)